jgi:hypothetical protein
MVYFPSMNKVIDNFTNYTNYNYYDETTSLGDNTDILLEDSYPLTGRKGISNNNAYNIWWHYPVFKVGSYAQITNNIKYPNNPDEGTCMPASMCGALYKEKQLKSNYVKPLPPVNPDCGTRVGYFATDINLLPYRNDMQNILY